MSNAGASPLLYVDNMIIIGDDIVGIHDLKIFPSHQFEMKDLGFLGYFLGLEVSTRSDGYFLSSQINLWSCLSSKLTIGKTVSAPLEANVRMTPSDSAPLWMSLSYRQLVGSGVYLIVTCLNIAYAIHIVSQFMVAARSMNYVVIFGILHYIKGTLFHGLHFST